MYWKKNKNLFQLLILWLLIFNNFIISIIGSYFNDINNNFEGFYYIEFDNCFKYVIFELILF